MATKTMRSTPTRTATTAARSGGAGCLLPLLIWLPLLLVVLLIAFRAPLLLWASDLEHTDLRAMALKLLLRPPGMTALRAALGLAALALILEGAWAAWSVMRRTLALPPPDRRVYLRIRIPKPETISQESGVALLRALHEILPAFDGSPWYSLVLSAAPDAPVQLGIQLAGGTPQQRATWIAAIRKAVRGINPEGVVDAVADPLLAVAGDGRLVQAREFRLAIPVSPHSAGNEPGADRERIDPMGPIVATLPPRAGVAYTELHITLQPQRDTAAQTDAFRVTARAVAVARERKQALAARGALDEIAIALSRYKVAEVGTSRRQRIAAMSSAGRVLLTVVLLILLAVLVRRTHLVAPIVAGWLPRVLVSLVGVFVLLLVLRICRPARVAQRRVLARVPRKMPPRLLAFWSWWARPLVLAASEISPLYHLPTAALGNAVRWLPFRIIYPPAEAFIPANPTEPWLMVGHGMRPDGALTDVGLPLVRGRSGIAVAAPPGVGKTQWAIRVFLFVIQTLKLGVFGMDGKGDDRKGFVGKARRMLDQTQEHRLVILDPLDSWAVSLNPLIGIDLADELGVDEALGQVESIFGRIDPETWKNSPRMAGVLRKIMQLVLYGETIPTLAHGKQVIEDGAYRAALLPACRQRNIEVAAFWEAIERGDETIGDATLSAIRSRFDILLDTRLMRNLFSLPLLSFSFEEAIAQRWIVLNPIPEDRLGGRAGPVGMLFFQMLMRAAYRRPGSDTTRENFMVMLDEFDFLVRRGNPEDVARALTKVRSFGIVLILLHQLLIQLGAFKDFVLAIPNRIIMRVGEPDASAYARLYPTSSIAEADIAGQDNHYYITTMYGRAPIGPYSAIPMDWLPEIEVAVPDELRAAWQEVLPPDSAYPELDAAVCDLVYGQYADRRAIVETLAEADGETWARIWERWQAIAATQRVHILAHPGCIPLPGVADLLADPMQRPDVQLVLNDAAALLTLQRDQQRIERQLWLSRLRIGIPPILTDVMYARIRRPVVPETDRAVVDERPTTSADASTPLLPEGVALTLPDTLLLADLLPELTPGQLIYGMLPSGQPLILGFGQAYHALAAGDTRTGKSNYLDAIITQLHHQAQHYDLRLFIGDFKREMAATWTRSPLVDAVEVDPQAIAELLEALAHGEDGILQRYDRFKELGEAEGRIVRNLGDYCKVTGEQPRITFAVIDEMNALMEAADKKSTLSSALKIVLQIGAGAGIYVLGGAQYLSSATFGRDGSKQFTTRALFGSYDQVATRMLFGGGRLDPTYRALLTGQPGRGLIRTVGQAEPTPFQAPRCDEDDILAAITIAVRARQERAAADDAGGGSTDVWEELLFPPSEIARLRTLIQRRAGKTEVLRQMPGYSGRKHPQYSTYYDELRRSLNQARTTSPDDLPDGDAIDGTGV